MNTIQSKSVKLTIENLSVKYGNKLILNNFNLDIKAGERVAILGESGYGKTTLLKAVAGIIDIEKGDIKIDDESIINVKAQDREVVILFQDLRLFPHLNVKKNIAFPLEIKKKSKTEIDNQVRDMLSRVKLSGFENRKIRELSGGQMQRVALARALASQPRVLLLDEPFSSLDEKLREEMGELLCEIQEQYKMTTLIVTHSSIEAHKIANRVIKLGEEI